MVLQENAPGRRTSPRRHARKGHARAGSPRACRSRGSCVSSCGRAGLRLRHACEFCHKRGAAATREQRARPGVGNEHEKALARGHAIVKAAPLDHGQRRLVRGDSIFGPPACVIKPLPFGPFRPYRSGEERNFSVNCSTRSAISEFRPLLHHARHRRVLAIFATGRRSAGSGVALLVFVVGIELAQVSNGCALIGKALVQRRPGKERPPVFWKRAPLHLLPLGGPLHLERRPPCGSISRSAGATAG